MRQLFIVLLSLIFVAPSFADSIEYGIIKLVDRGRLTPFGRTYDIYLDTDGRVPSFLHAGRSWICDPDNDDGPFDTLGKENKDAWIEIENSIIWLQTWPATCCSPTPARRTQCQVCPTSSAQTTRCPRPRGPYPNAL